MKDRYLDIIDAFKGVRLLVIGDVMLDQYTWCDVKRISPEAPVPVAVITRESYFLGGAANVAHNVRSLGAQVSLVGFVGQGNEKELVDTLLAEKNISTQGLILDPKRKTTIKRRIFSGTQQLLRIDSESTNSVTDEIKEVLIGAIDRGIQECDAIIISDYCKGLFSDDIIEHIKNRAHEQMKKIFVDSKNKYLLKYRGVYLVKPNKEEAELFVREQFTHSYSNLESIGRKLTKMFKSNVVITLGGDGIAAFEGGTFIRKHTKAQEVFDVSGAGDTVLSVIATASVAGASLEEAIELSNVAAGHVVCHLGTTVCDQEVLRDLCFDR